VGAPAVTTTSTTTATTSSTTTTTTPGTTTSTLPPPATTTTSPGVVAESLLARSINAANSEPALTWTMSATAEGQSEREVSTVGQTDGTATLQARLGDQNWNEALVLLGSRIYVLANVYPLEQIVGLKASAAKSESDTWFYIPSSDGYLFQTLSYGLTVATATGALNLVGTPTILRGGTVMGQSVIGLRQVDPQGAVTSIQTVYVRAHGTPLPVEVQNSFEGTVQSVVFGDWGQAPLAQAPNGAVPFKKSWLLKPLPNF
jgi:hypothetical protein